MYNTNQRLRLHLHEVAVPIGTARLAPPSLQQTLPFRIRRGYQWGGRYGSEAEIGRVDNILWREEDIDVGEVSVTYYSEDRNST